MRFRGRKGERFVLGRKGANWCSERQSTNAGALRLARDGFRSFRYGALSAASMRMTSSAPLTIAPRWPCPGYQWSSQLGKRSAM